MKNTIKEMAALAASGNLGKEAHTLNLFSLGCKLNTEPTTLTMRQLGKALGVNYIDLSFAKSLAKRHNNSMEDFKNACEHEYKSYTWTVIKRFKVGKRDVHNGTIAEHLRLLRHKIANGALQDEDGERIKAEVMKIYRFAKHHFLPKESLVDQNFLKYHECSCCGAYPPPEEGYSLGFKQTEEGHQLVYPVCANCAEMDIGPDNLRIAKMYQIYAHDLEDAYERLML